MKLVSRGPKNRAFASIVHIDARGERDLATALAELRALDLAE
ncbi:MAG: hypothetical protein ABI467_10905 [Kofleriaceae bacterium]